MQFENTAKRKCLIWRKWSFGKLKNDASQEIDTPTRSLRENIDIFPEFSCISINSAIKSKILPSSFKLADVAPCITQGEKI